MHANTTNSEINSIEQDKVALKFALKSRRKCYIAVYIYIDTTLTRTFISFHHYGHAEAKSLEVSGLHH